MTGFDTPEIRAAEDDYQAGIEAEQATVAEQTARLAEIYERPALGAYRKDRKPRPYPADAPPLPPASRTDWTADQLATAAAWMAGERIERGVASEVLTELGRRSGLCESDIVSALRGLLR